MSSAWRHYPWLLGLGLAPLLFGAVNPEGQAVVAVLFAASLAALAFDLAPNPPLMPRPWQWVALGLLVLPLLPLPAPVVDLLQPARAKLARDFPLEPGTVPAWITLSCSPASSVERLWELGLAVACFFLARHAAKEPGFLRLLTITLGATALALVASDVWYRLHGKRSVLGLWQISWGTGAGTFANPNHFANWLYVAALFLVGAMFRAAWPFQSARPAPVVPRRRGWLLGAGVGLVIVASLAAAVASGSRGGFLAASAGAGVWLLLLLCRGRRSGRWALVAFGSLVVCTALSAVSGLLVRKFSLLDAASLAHYSKFQLWDDSLGTAVRFPWLGVGWGAFATAFNYFKTGWGEFTCWHVENEYLELFLETGLVGVVVFGWFLLRLAITAGALAWKERLPEPELLFAAVAGLAAYSVHASVEFVFQVPATALLAATLAGCVAAAWDQRQSPVIVPLPSRFRVGVNLGFASLLGLAGVVQALALWHWQQAAREPSPGAAVRDIQASLRLWPWAVHRQLGLTRQQVALHGDLEDSGRHLAGNELRDELNDRLAWDPLNWELRLERVWLDLAFSTNAQRSLAEAREVTRLNPRQPQIPLRFARHYAPRQPPLAREFLHATERTNAALLREVLLLSWQLAPDTSQLWSLTPVSREGLTTLASFGLEQQLYPLAAQASLMLTNFEYPETVAEKLLAARRPDLALGQLTRAGQTWGADYLACRAQFELGRWSEAIRLFERMKARSRFRDPPGAPPGQGDVVASLKRAWEQQPGDLLAAQALAQALGARPPAQRDMVLLRQLAQFFPNDFAILWVLFTTQRDTGLERDAAETAVRLAGYLAGR